MYWVLRVGLSGGIGSGKSTVAARLARLGAVVVDADRIAREVVEPGERALAEVRERFGDDVVTDEGTLDRAALGRLVFADREALRALEAITHPAIRARTAERVAAAVRADPAAVVVHDMPLLVEQDLGPGYHLVLVVDTDEETRVRRLVGARGMDEDDARARVRAQASDAERRAAADVLLDNTGTPELLERAVDALWTGRVLPFEANLRRREPAPGPGDPGQPPGGWAAQAARTGARLRRVLGDALGDVTGGPDADGVLHLDAPVADQACLDVPDVLTGLADAGFPRLRDGGGGPARLHGSADPGRPARVRLRAG